MKACVVDRYGTGQTLRLTELSDPVVGAHDLLIAIEVTALW